MENLFVMRYGLVKTGIGNVIAPIVSRVYDTHSVYRQARNYRIAPSQITAAACLVCNARGEKCYAEQTWSNQAFNPHLETPLSWLYPSENTP